MAIDAGTKLAPCWTLGKRDGETADVFASDMASRLLDRAQITPDDLAAYMGAVVKAFGEEVDYARLIKVYGKDSEGEKRYSPATCTSCKKENMIREPDPKHISSSVIEHQNLTMRIGCADSLG